MIAKVRHIWSDINGENEISIPPTFYADSGNPLDDDGDEMVYVRTEIES